MHLTEAGAESIQHRAHTLGVLNKCLFYYYLETLEDTLDTHFLLFSASKIEVVGSCYGKLAFIYFFFFFNPPNIYGASTLQAWSRGQSCDQVATVPAGPRLWLSRGRQWHVLGWVGGHRDLPGRWAGSRGSYLSGVGVVRSKPRPPRTGGSGELDQGGKPGREQCSGQRELQLQRLRRESGVQGVPWPDSPGRALRLERPPTVLGGHPAVPHEPLLEGHRQPG